MVAGSIEQVIKQEKKLYLEKFQGKRQEKGKEKLKVWTAKADGEEVAQEGTERRKADREELGKKTPISA